MKLSNKLTKVQFFDQLAELVGKKMYILHSGHRIGNITVEKTQGLVGHPFKVIFTFTGRVGKRMQWLDPGNHIKTFSCRIGWVENSWKVQDLLDYRTIEVIEDTTTTKEEVKPVQKEPVVINAPVSTTNLVEFAKIGDGVPFWYNRKLYMADDEGGALRLEDGTMENLDIEALVLPTTIEITVTGDVQ